MSRTALLAFQPDAMSPTRLAAVSFLARYSGHTHALYAYQLRRWFGWCAANDVDPLVGIQRAHVALYIRHLGECGGSDLVRCARVFVGRRFAGINLLRS